MSDTKHTTTLEIRAETRGIKDVGKELGKAFDPKLMAAFAANIDKMSAAMEGMVELQQKLVDLQKQSNREGAAGGGSGGGRRGGGGGGGGPRDDNEQWDRKITQARRRAEQQEKQEQRQGERETTNRRRMMMGMGVAGAYGMGRMASNVSNLAAAATGGTGLAEGVLGMIPFIGQGLAGTVGALRRYSGMAEGYGSARGGAFGNTGRINYGSRVINEGDEIGDDEGGSLASRFGAHGLSLMEAPGMMAGFGQSTGLRGEGLQGVAPGLLDMQRGMGLGNAGGMIRANMTGGGEASMKPIRDAIAQGMAAGLTEGGIDDYLAQIAQHVEAARTEGVNLTTDSITSLVSGFGALGLRGAQATHAATTTASSVRNLGDDTSFGSQVALRIAMAGGAETGGTGPRGFEEARAFIEANPQTMIPLMLAAGRDLSGGSRGVLSGTYRRMGLGLTPSQAWTMAGEGGVNGFGGASAESQAAANGLIDQRTQEAQAAAGASVHRAGLTNTGIGIGSGGAGSAIRSIERTEMGVAQNMASALTGPMTTLATTMREMLESFNGAGGGLSGIKAILSDVLGPLLREAAQAAGRALKEALPDSPMGEGAGVLVDAALGGPETLQNALRTGLVLALQDYFGPVGRDMGQAIVRGVDIMNGR